MYQITSTFKIPYSLKNIIPTINNFLYQKLVFARTEKFSTSMRWKLVWFMTPFQQKEKKEYVGFKSTTKLFAMFEIKRFEMELIRMVSNIEMRPFNNNPQDRMKEDIQHMQEIKEMIVSLSTISSIRVSTTKPFRRNTKKGQ